MAGESIVGAPLITPVEALTESPAGNVGVTTKPKGAVPVPVFTVTGVNGTATVFAVSALVATTWVEAKGALTWRANVLPLTAPTLSVTVTA